MGMPPCFAQRWALWAPRALEAPCRGTLGQTPPCNRRCTAPTWAVRRPHIMQTTREQTIWLLQTMSLGRPRVAQYVWHTVLLQTEKQLSQPALWGGLLWDRLEQTPHRHGLRTEQLRLLGRLKIPSADDSGSVRKAPATPLLQLLQRYRLASMGSIRSPGDTGDIARKLTCQALSPSSIVNQPWGRHPCHGVWRSPGGATHRDLEGVKELVLATVEHHAVAVDAADCLGELWASLHEAADQSYKPATLEV